MMKKLDFLHVDTDSYWAGRGQKMGVATLFSGL